MLLLVTWNGLVALTAPEVGALFSFLWLLSSMILCKKLGDLFLLSFVLSFCDLSILARFWDYDLARSLTIS